MQPGEATYLLRSKWDSLGKGDAAGEQGYFAGLEGIERSPKYYGKADGEVTRADDVDDEATPLATPQQARPALCTPPVHDELYWNWAPEEIRKALKLSRKDYYGNPYGCGY